MKIGVYGGAFNPPHKGHGKAMEAVIEGLELDLLLLVPTGEPPHKKMPEGSPEPVIRGEMCKNMANTLVHARKRQGKSACAIKVYDFEISRSAVSYTVDTLEALRKDYPEDELWLLLGEDMFLAFYQWKDYAQVAKFANLCAFMRSDQEPSPPLLAQAEKIQTELGTKVHLQAVDGGVRFSSTAVREDFQQGRLSSFLYPCTKGLILEKGLYGTAVDWKNMTLPQLRSWICYRVKPKRIPHILGVELECVQLSRRWGGDEILARRAGILHDVSKYWSHQEHLDYCDSHNYPLDPLERETEKLLHAKTGAIIAKDLLGEAPEVVEAIACHTTGKANMSILDKILYLADYIERNRDFPELEKMRGLAYENLDSAVGYGLEIACQEMAERSKVTHFNTLEAFEQYGVKQ